MPKRPVMLPVEREALAILRSGGSLRKVAALIGHLRKAKDDLAKTRQELKAVQTKLAAAELMAGSAERVVKALNITEIPTVTHPHGQAQEGAH